VSGTYGTPALPLRIARLPQREGGLGLPQLHATNGAAFMAQTVATVPARLLHLLPHLRLSGDDDGGGGGSIAGTASPGSASGASLPPLLSSFRKQLRHWDKQARAEAARAERRELGIGTQHDDDGDVVPDGCAAPAVASQRTARDEEGDVIMGLHAFATQSSTDAEPDYDSNGDAVPGTGGASPPPPFTPPRALAGVIPPPLLERAARGPATIDGIIRACVRSAASSPSNPITEELLRAAGQMGYVDRVVDVAAADRDGGEAAAEGERRPKVQSALTNLVVLQQRRTLVRDLQRSGGNGQVALAQLHSQRGPGALSWLHCPPGRISSFAAAQMVLVSLCVRVYLPGAVKSV
jgi:hypothetical protein